MPCSFIIFCIHYTIHVHVSFFVSIIIHVHVLLMLFTCIFLSQLAWPYILHRMMKAYTVLDNTFIVPERLDRAPQLRVPRGSFLSQPELFLWRNYLFFACCSAPPSSSPYPVPPTQGLYEAGLLLGDKVR